MTTAIQPATLAGRRLTSRLLSGLRSAPYLRKWLVLGVLIGVVAGLGAVVFFYGLEEATHLLLVDLGGYTPARTAGEGGYQAASRFARPWAVPLVVGLGGLLAGILVFRFAPEAEGHGTDAAIKAVHTNPKGVRPRVIGVKLLASAITIGSGGSGGREGPTAQISSGFGSVLARALNLTPADARICVAAGIAAGIGAIFRAPFGGALLGVELLYTDDVEFEAFIPSVVATVVGYAIFCAITGSFAPIFGDHSGAAVPHAWEYALFVAVGLLAGLAGRLYTATFYALTAAFTRLSRVPRAVRPALAGVVVGLIGLAVPGVLGTGYGELQGELMLRTLTTTPLWAILLIPVGKVLATGLTIGSGGSGGIFGPGMVIGGATGALLWRVLLLAGLHLPGVQVAFVIVGMAACFGSIAHAPIAVLLMVAEMTGSLALLPPAMLGIAFAALVVGETTIYRSQLRRREDSPAHRFDLGLPTPASVPVTDLMAEPRLVVTAATPAREALAAIRDLGLPGAPVVDGAGAFIGSLQEATLAEAVEGPAAAERSDPAALPAAAAGALPAADAGERRRTAGRLADREAMTLPVEAGLDAAIDALPASKGGWVPVLDDRMRVVGIVATTDLVRGWRQVMRQAVRRVAGSASHTVVVDATVEPSSVADRTTIAALPLPRGAVVVSVTRNRGYVFPDRTEALGEGDLVTVLCRRGDGPAIRALFEGRDPAEPDGGSPGAPAGGKSLTSTSVPAHPRQALGCVVEPVLGYQPPRCDPHGRADRPACP